MFQGAYSTGRDKQEAASAADVSHRQWRVDTRLIGDDPEAREGWGCRERTERVRETPSASWASFMLTPILITPWMAPSKLWGLRMSICLHFHNQASEVMVLVIAPS